MRRRDGIALILVASVLVVAPFALGGAPRWAICLTSLLSVGCAATFLTSQRELGKPPPLLLFVALAALLTFLQVLPLPAGLVAILSPGKHQLVVDNARALGQSAPSWIALSLDPSATLVELAKLCGHVAFAYAALRLAASPARRQWLLAAVALVGAAMAVTALAHVLVGADRVFGIYQPKQALTRPTLAPLLNQNHLSALMALCTPIALGLAIAGAARVRLAWIGVATLCAAVCLLAESRGGALALVIGVVAVGILTFLQRPGTRPAAKLQRSDLVAVAVVAMSGLVLLGALTAGGVVRDLSSTRMGEVHQADSKFAVWRSSSTLLDEFRWTGIGRGAFEAASTRVHDSHAVVFPHAENEYLQAAVDWGFLGAGALALVLVWLATTAARAARSSPWEAGAFAGLAGLAVENLTDFSLWIPGVAYPALATLAALTPVALADARRARRVWRAVRAIGLATVVSAVAVAASPVGKAARVETDDLAARARSSDAKTALARASAVWSRHPADYVAAGMTARALFSARDRRAIAVVNRALTMHPTSGDLHRLAAQMLLASQQRAQARTEYALALRYRSRPEMLDEILAAFPADEDAVQALPLVPAKVRQWADDLRQRGRVPLALAYLERYLSLFPKDGPILLHTAAAALDAGKVELAAATAKRAHALDPTAEATIMVARSLSRQGRGAEATAMLQQEMEHPRRSGRPAERVEIHLALAEVQTAQGALDAARETLKKATGVAQGKQLAQVHRKLAEIEDRLGNKHQATWERQRAADLDR